MATMTEQTMLTTMAAAAISSSAAASTAIASAGASAVATVATVAGNGRAFTAQKGQSDNREQDRDAQNQCTIHSNILQTSTVA